MQTKDIISALSAKVITLTDETKKIENVYAGDFLSRVISRVPENAVWLTIMANINVAGVMTLADIPVVVLCEGVEPDQTFISKAQTERLCILSTSLSVFDACAALAAIK